MTDLLPFLTGVQERWISEDSEEVGVKQTQESRKKTEK
jgi:hypothetical protein